MLSDKIYQSHRSCMGLWLNTTWCWIDAKNKESDYRRVNRPVKALTTFFSPALFIWQLELLSAEIWILLKAKLTCTKKLLWICLPTIAYNHGVQLGTGGFDFSWTSLDYQNWIISPLCYFQDYISSLNVSVFFNFKDNVVCNLRLV